MTEQRVRELLSEVADAVPPPQLAERAWRQSVRVRRRRVAATAVVAVGTVVAVIGIVGALNDGAGTIPRPDGDQDTRMVANPPLRAGLPRPPDTQIDGGPAWVGPTVQDEARLPSAHTTALPSSIDLASSATSTDKPGPAMAAFAATDPEHQMTEVMVVKRDGGVSRLETPGLDVVHNTENGDPVLPLNISSLSPDGRKLVLAQNHQVVIYDLVAGGHRDLSTKDQVSYNVGWTSDGKQIQLPKGVIDPKTHQITTPKGPMQGDGSDQGGPTPIWPPRASGQSTAQAVSDRPVSALGPTLGNDPVLIRVWGGGRRATLALPSDTEDLNPRSRVVGWLGENVAFQSQGFGSFRVLSWDTDNGAVRVLTNVTLPDGWDQGVTASWADVSHQPGFAQ